jgi:hypothetical protein
MSMSKHNIRGSHYGFSATKISELGAAEYTLVTIAADVSGSVTGFEHEITHCIKEVVRACRHSPRSDNLMLRLVTFDDKLHEFHGFKPLRTCNVDDYDTAVRIGGSTALYDATINAVDAINLYGKHLTDNDLSVNGIVFVITDGMDNASNAKAKSVKKAVADTLKREGLESLTTVLVGVNISQTGVSKYLNRVKKSANFDQYVELAKADAATLAKLADFVGRSIFAQSRALGSGSSSGLLTF